jgi:hypothetical protein
MASPTRYLSGVATTPASTPLGNLPFPDPFHTSGNVAYDATIYSNDFFGIGSTTLDWTIVGTSSTFTSTDGIGGISLITPGGATTATTVYKTGSSFQFVAGQKFWYVARVKASAVAGSVSLYFGLQKGSATTDGLWFSKAASSTSLNLVSTVNSTATTLVTGVTTAAANTYMDVAFYYDGTDILVYVNDVVIARVAAPTIGATGTTLTNALLTPVFQITPTATDTMSIDYVLAGQETVR